MASGSRTSEPQAIVVGSKAPWKQTRPDGKTIDWGLGQDWRYACYPLAALRERLKAGAPDDDLFEPKKNPADHVPIDVLTNSMKQPNGLLTSADRNILAALGFSGSYLDNVVTVPTGGGAVLKPTRRQTAILLRDVERIFFFSSDGGIAVKQPFAALDCARFVDPAADPRNVLPHAFDAPAPADTVPTGSRIVLFPDFTDSTRPGALAAVAIHIGIKVAINGHRIVSTGEKKAIDRHDTRMLLDLGIRGGGTGTPLKNLWVTKPGTEAPAGERGLRFDRMRLRCTLAPFLGANSRSDPVIVDKSDLLAFARNNSKERGKTNAEHANDDSFRVHHVPALAALGFPDAPILVSREFGFRALGGIPKPKSPGIDPDDTIDRIGWRFELWAFEYSKTFLSSSSLQPVAPDAVNAALPNTLILFAEEQRYVDIGLHLDPERAARTILTARLSTHDAVSTEDQAVTKAVLAVLDDSIEKVHAGLKAAEDGRPLSLLPRLQASNPGVPWHVIGAVIDRTPGTRALFDPHTASQAGAPREAVVHTFEPRRRFDMWAGLSSAASLDVKAIQAKATFARLETDDRAYPRYDAELFVSRLPETRAEAEIASTDAPAFQPAVSADDPAGVALGMRLGFDLKRYLGVVPPTWNSSTAAKQGSRDLVIGALQFTLAEAVDHARNVAKRGLIVLRPLDPDRDGDPAQPEMGIDAVLQLPIEMVGPASEDEPQGATRVSARERRRRPLDQNRPDADAPLLLALKAPAASTTISLTLQSEEVATRDRDHTIALSLRSIPEEQNGDGIALPAPLVPAQPVQRPRVLVIEPGPFRVAAIDYDEITGLATSETNEVAVWNESGEGGLSWRVRDEGQIVDLLLPPQVVGEAMEKNRSDLAGRPKDVEPGRPAAVRFGSLTRLKIDPTFAQTRFREPGWNLRRILGFALQRNPGARLLDLRLELLYGLLARLRASDVWITEIAGAIGEPPVPLTEAFERPHLQRHAALIDAVLDAERRRIAVEKLWRERPDEDLRLEEGVSFLIRRRTKDDGGVPSGGPTTPLRWPTPGGVPAEPGGLIEKDVLDATFSASEKDEESFPGGLAWAFESPNILMRVYGRPRSDGGSLRGVHLTALGGYGSQRALFDERKSIVETETTQGRVQRYRLERIGRIACLWHPAKHVIVYERTVVPPAQFYNRPPIGRRQDEHLGRAIPRKVEEYVEILKPKRQYPEDATSLRACGFVVGAEFKSIKIRVDSSWGSDVRREGWQVPLWSTAFLGLRPNPNDPDDPVNLYPKPQICLNLAGEGGKEIPHEVAEPEKLYFYTSVVAGEDDSTDLWKPVRDVDFCDLPFPVTARVRTESADLSDTMLRGEPDHVPGYERFTIALVPAKEAVALTHGRVAGGPVAALRNVTIARAVSHDVAAATPVQDFGREIAAKAANARAEIDRRVGQVLGELEKLNRDTDPQHLQDEAKKLLDGVLSKLGADKLQAAIANTQDGLKTFAGLTLPGGICEGLSGKLREQVQGQFNRLVIIAGDVLKQAAAAIGERIDAAAGVVGVEIGRLSAVLEQADAVAAGLKRAQIEADKQRKRKEALDAAKSATATIAALVQDIRNTAAAAIKQRIELAKARLDSLPGELRADLLSLRQRTHADLQAAKALVAGGLETRGGQLKDAVKAAAEQAQTVLDKLAAAGASLDQTSIDAAKGLRTTIETHRSKLRDAMANLEGSNVPAAARRILQALDIGIGALLAAAAKVENGAIGDATAPLVARINDAKTSIAELKTAVDTRIAQASGGVDRVASILDGVLDAAFTKIDKTDGILDQISARTGAIKTSLGEFAASLTQLVDDVLKPLEKATTDLGTALAAAVPTNPIPATLVTAAEDVGKKAQGGIGIVRDRLVKLNAAAAEARQFLTGEIDKAAAALKAEVEQLATKVKDQLTILINELSKTCEALEGFVKEIFKDAQKIADKVNQWIGDTFDVAGYRKQLEDEVKSAIDGSAKTIVEIKAAAAAAAARVTERAEARARQLAGTIQETVRDITGGADLTDLARRADGVYQKGDTALRALRALGDPPKTNNLGFNRPEVAYVLGEAKKLGIDMTPALALVNRATDQVAAIEQAGKAVGELLDSFGVRLPMNEIADQLIPEKLKGLSVSDLLPDMGGIDFKGLLQRVGFPDLDDSNAVKIRHGFDKATMRAWMEADLNVPFTEAAPLLSIGPVEIVIDTAKFTSQARLSAGVEGTERKMNGRIFGDWRVVCAGQSIITFRQTGLYFDESGKIDFRIQPDRIEIAEALRFVTDLMAATGKKGGVRIQPFVRGGIPSGVAATLDMVLPPIQTGAFGISDLSLHILFGIAALPRFEIVCELSVGTRMAPFTLNVWILNGGGYLTQQLSYLPTSKPRPLMTYTLDIGVLVGLGLGFSFGVVSGGVWVQVGCGVAFTWVTGGGSTTAMRVFLLVRGNVDVAGLITAALALLFEVTYDGERMIGAGTLTISVKISMFFTLSVHEHVEYLFAGEKKGGEDGYSDGYC
jgi:hypothetical protein